MLENAIREGHVNSTTTIPHNQFLVNPRNDGKFPGRTYLNYVKELQHA
jgi:hypothetical protein